MMSMEKTKVMALASYATSDTTPSTAGRAVGSETKNFLERLYSCTTWDLNGFG